MGKSIKIGWMALFMQFMIFTSSAQWLAGDDSAIRSVSLGYTNNAFASLELGYAQNPGKFQKKNWQVYGRVGLPLLLMIKDHSLDSWKIELGAHTELVSLNKFSLMTDSYLFLIHHNQILGVFTPVGVNLSLMPAYPFKQGYLGIQVRWNQTVATHISHSNYVKNTFAGLSTLDNRIMNIHPENGWYGFTGSHLDFGIGGIRTLGSKCMLSAELGVVDYLSPYTGFFDALMMGQVPFYLEMRFFYKL